MHVKVDARDDVLDATTDLQLGADALRPTLRAGGTALYDVEHFRVLRVLGQGGMGRVLLARDTRLGRLVALKIIRPDQLDPDRALALLDEARLTARLSHPNIVQIHHVGRVGAAPYLALEYVDGVTLRQRMREGSLGEREVVRIGAAIAAALAAAHAGGVTHRDLKPENVMVARDGRPRVLDFGIAATLETLPNGMRRDRGGDIAGTPGYMAPEQLMGAPAAPPADLWALGVLLYEALTGSRPCAADAPRAAAVEHGPRSDARLPPELQVESHGLAELIEALLQRAPERRPSAPEAARRLEAMLQPDSAQRQAAGPFRGLLAFEESDAAWFFGREAEVDALVEHLRHTTVVPVVGPSGAGKSSLVRAGLLPRLREQDNWIVLALRPGASPLLALASRLLARDTTGQRALATTGGREGARALAARLRDEPRACNLELHALADAHHCRVLLVVDQLEEVVTHVGDDGERDAFLDAIAEAADAVDEQIRVVFTLRDDFLGRVALRPSMRKVLRNVVVLRRLDDAALRAAIALPLARAGASLDDPSLPDDMVAAVRGEPAALPMVQFACAQLWERRDRTTGQLRRVDYEAIGGVAGALGRHAEAVLVGMVPDQVELARRLLVQMVGPEGARRVVRREEALAGAGAGADAVVERLTSARLLAVRRNHDGRAEAVSLELAHESLAQTWPQLQRWLEESIDERSALADVEAAAALWARRGRREGELWSGEAERDARRRLRDAAVAMSEDAGEFLRASAALAARARRLRAVGWAAVGAVLVAVAVGSLAVASQLSEREQRTRALAQRLEVSHGEVVAKNREIERKSVEARLAAAAAEAAAADMGEVELRLEFFDWNHRTLKAEVSPAVPVGVEFWDTDPEHPLRATRKRDARWTRVGQEQLAGSQWTARIEARAGPAVLRVLRNDCAAVDIPLRQFPGWSNRRERQRQGLQPPVWTLPVPSCAATRAGMVRVPAGPYIEGGAGVPPLRSPGDAAPEERRELEAFDIDITEAPNALWSVLAQARRWTGVADPGYPASSAFSGIDAPDHPVAGLDAFRAEALCRWLGRRLPRSHEWTKAARGGLHLADGSVNPMPRRSLPWGGTNGTIVGLRGRANLLDTPDPFRTTSAITAFPEGASPYGVVDLVGNVSEWTETPSGDPTRTDARIVRGAAFEFPVAAGMHSVSVLNERSPRYFDFSLGVRCCADVAIARP